MAELTPMMRQYLDIKEKHQDCILFFRLGDFYEMFGDDANTAARELDLTLTTRDRATKDPDERIPMCGVPYHSAEAYVARLIAKGYKVAICEQMEDPATAKGLVDRDIVRIVTPGTVIETSMLDESKPNYICGIYCTADTTALCFADISTGEMSAAQFPASDVSRALNEINAYSPAEAVINDMNLLDGEIRKFLSDKIGSLTQEYRDKFEYDDSCARTCAQFKAESLNELGLEGQNAMTCAIGGLLSYLDETQNTNLSHINKLALKTRGEFMELDFQAVRNLELVASNRTSEKKGSLLWILDKTKTAMGRRTLRAWALRPLLSPASIKRRLHAVEELFGDTVKRSEIILTLGEIGDIERLIGKVVYGSANGRDLKSLSASLGVLPELKLRLSGGRSALLNDISRFDELGDIFSQIESAVVENPPFSIREGGIIKNGYSADVDKLRSLLANSTETLAQIEAREKERTGKKLKVGYNRVFGYFIEIPRSVSDDVPEDYIRKQTLTNCERFITQELKELETQLLTAKDRLASLEYDLFNELRESVAAEVVRVQNTARAVAAADALCSLAETAVKNNYCMPEVDISGVIDIRDGRHPVVEQMQKDSLFVPNDAFLDGDTSRVSIITGPNMAGKSTFMRQVALIALMAQMGSFVPASYARIGIVDRVFTRIGASDDLSGGLSTFMVEMTEVADILKNATRSSLIILDEIGRGTSTFDGMSIAMAVLEHCADTRKLGAKTMFATHYHELTKLEDSVAGVKNYNISTKKRGGELIFLRKIIPGGADRSYGIEVAGLAGVPASVVRRAKEILKDIESSGHAAPALENRSEDDGQVSMSDIRGSVVADTLSGVDLDSLTPLEAMNLLYELKKKLENRG